VTALRTYRACFARDAKPNDLIFGRKAYYSISFRRSLAKAGVFGLHPELALHGKAEGDRRQIRIHDLRRFFVTLAVAQGRGDGYIRSHTGHTGAVMITHYTDAAGVLKARGTVTLVPLHEAIPELLELVNRLQSSTASAAE
jgi:integrase